jgi:Leucine-rich repeat (LRR) protein
VRTSVAGGSSSLRPSAAGASSEAEAAAAANTGGPPLDLAPGFQALTWLDLSYNSLSAEQLLSASSPVPHLPALKHLAAAGCGLQQLPEHLGPFTTLSSLDLSHNGLRSAALIPLGSLSALKVLQLAGNALSSIPQPAVAGAGAFPALQMLGLAATKVREVAAVAAGLVALPELQRVWLGGTPLSSLAAKRLALQQVRVRATYMCSL